MFVARIVIFVLIFALLIWLLTSTAVIVHQKMRRALTSSDQSLPSQSENHQG